VSERFLQLGGANVNGRSFGCEFAFLPLVDDVGEPCGSFDDSLVAPFELKGSTLQAHDLEQDLIQVSGG
jgi:hypothetical protein